MYRRMVGLAVGCTAFVVQDKRTVVEEDSTLAASAAGVDGNLAEEGSSILAEDRDNHNTAAAVVDAGRERTPSCRDKLIRALSLNGTFIFTDRERGVRIETNFIMFEAP